MNNQLIQIYLLVCQIYDSHSSLKYQRASNFKPVFSDEEIIPIYLFGQLNEKFKHRQIYNFIGAYWREWFLALPSYQAFNRRLNLLSDNFQLLFAHLLESLDFNLKEFPVCLQRGFPYSPCKGVTSCS